MQKNKILLFSLYLLVGVLIIASCQKETPIIEEPVIEEPVISFDVQKNASAFPHLITEIFSLVLTETVKHPEILYGFSGNPAAEVRTDCPATMGSSTFPTIVYPYTLNLFFDNCPPELNGSTQSQNELINGNIDIVFPDSLFRSNQDLCVTLSSGFTIGDYSVTDSGMDDIKIVFKTRNDSTKIIKIEFPEDVTILNGSTMDTTFVPSIEGVGAFNFIFTDDPLNNNNSADPITRLDDHIGLRLPEHTITCTPEGGVGMDVSLHTDQRLTFKPFECGCITRGKVDIGGEILDYGYGAPDPVTGVQQSNEGCDSWARNTTTGTPVELTACN